MLVNMLVYAYQLTFSPSIWLAAGGFCNGGSGLRDRFRPMDGNRCETFATSAGPGLHQ